MEPDRSRQQNLLEVISVLTVTVLVANPVSAHKILNCTSVLTIILTNYILIQICMEPQQAQHSCGPLQTYRDMKDLSNKKMHVASWAVSPLMT